MVLPLYMYDHSGITIALTPFNCRWDSGQVGFVQVPRLKMMEEFSKKIFTKQLKEKGLLHAQAEVETLDVYIKGDVCGFVVDDHDDSCWGFFSVKDALEAARESIDYTIKHNTDKHCNQLKTWIKNKVPMEHRSSMEV